VRVFVAGASGAIGRPLLPKLAAAGHQVTGMTRSEEKAAEIRAAGAEAAVCDVFDTAAVEAAVDAAQPEAVIAELTALPKVFDPRKIDYGPTNRIRVEGGRNVIAAARKAGARRYITQSIAFLYAPEGGEIKDEEARPFTDAREPFGEAARQTLTSEREALEAEGMAGLVLRYGWFYGPGTYFARDGSTAEMVKARRYPIVGRGTGINSFIHVEDAADATIAALSGGSPGIYNVVDDDPAPLHEWLPVYAEALGAKRPWRVPKLIARIAAGRFAAEISITLRGAANAKAKRELGWQPAHPSWRQGFRESLS
jgi:nucleoside-diphosphate-sugar epimerase